MRLVRFAAQGHLHFGHLEGDTVVPVAGESFVEALVGRSPGPEKSWG